MDEETKKRLDALFEQIHGVLSEVESEEAVGYIEWMLQKAQLRYQEKGNILFRFCTVACIGLIGA